MTPLSIPQLADRSRLPDFPVKLGRGAKAAQEFEATLVASVLQSMEQTFAAVPGENNLPGSDNYDYLATQALAAGIAAHGGLGIAAVITHSLALHEARSPIQPVSDTATASKVSVPFADGRR